MAHIYVLTARERTTYTAKPTKILRAFVDEIAATEIKLMIEDCNPAMDVEVVKVPLVASAKHGPEYPTVKVPQIFGGGMVGAIVQPPENMAVAPIEPPEDAA